MRIQKIQLIKFKRFDELTIDLWEDPKKIIALVGPNGCGKSSIIDAFSPSFTDQNYNNKKLYDDSSDKSYSRNNSIKIWKMGGNQEYNQANFYVRSSQRHSESVNFQFNQGLRLSDDPWKPTSTSSIDWRINNNYNLLMMDLIKSFQSWTETWSQVRARYIDKINGILSVILDIQISNLADVTDNQRWDLYFEKWSVKNFPFKNLSTWEKAIVDLIMDLVLKIEVFNNRIIFIDEPELHISTAIQRKLIVEISKMIPNDSQLWIATHSIGFLRAFQNELSDITDVIYMWERNFDESVSLSPIVKNRKMRKKIFETALDDLNWLLAPEIIVYCEWKALPNWQTWEEGWLDALIYNQIFENEFPEYYFISSWGNSELDKHSHIALKILEKAFIETEILRLKDRDVETDWSITALQRTDYLQSDSKLRMLKRREIENYIFDFEILSKEYPTITIELYNTIVSDIDNDDIKLKITQLKTLCWVETSISKDWWKKLLAKHITSDTDIYQELKNVLLNQ